MGRPSVRAERREQILQATARCVATFGLADLTLEKIAEESGMSRGHVRHYIGNREDLIVALATWVHSRTDDELESGLADAAEDLDSMLDYLYGAAFSEPSDENTIILELLNASRTNVDLRQAMLNGYTETRKAIGETLARELPGVAADTIAETSYALLALALGNAVMSDLDRGGNSDRLVRQAAVQLLAPFRHATGSEAHAAIRA